MRNKIRSILYNINESNSNNPANLLVGQEVEISKYSPDGKKLESLIGRLEVITNEYVVIKDEHNQQDHNFVYIGFNAHENAIEFQEINDPNFKFFVY